MDNQIIRKRIHIYGKKNCVKCDLLKRRFAELLPSDCIISTDLTEIKGILEFCKQERLSAQKIPLFIVETKASPSSSFVPLEMDISDSFKNCIYGWCGVYTDYSDLGTLPPEMLSSFIEKYYKNLT